MKAGCWNTSLALPDLILVEVIPIISENWLSLLTENKFQTSFPLLFEPPIPAYWYLRYLSDPTPLLFGTGEYWLTRFLRFCWCSLIFSRIDHILLAAIQGSPFHWPVHTVVTYHNLRNACKFLHLTLDSERAKQLLPQAYVPYTNILPKSWLGLRINMQWVIWNTG